MINLYKTYQTKSEPFYFTNIRAQMQFQGRQPCSELQPPVLETSCRFSQIHPYPRGRIVAGNFSSNMAAFSGLGAAREG